LYAFYKENSWLILGALGMLVLEFEDDVLSLGVKSAFRRRSLGDKQFYFYSARLLNSKPL